MSMQNTTQNLKFNERNHVEKPLLAQLDKLGWNIIDLDSKQHPGDSHRQSFTEVVMLPVLHEQLKVINPWLEDDQVEEVVKQLTASFPGSDLIKNNHHAFTLLLENTSVSENRQTGEKSPTVRFVDFTHKDNNSFIAVCQFKVRILGTEHHIIPDIVLFLNGLPVVVIECKSPKVKDAIPEAIDQMLRYSEQRGVKGEGSAPIFFYNQIVIATCRNEAKFGTITTHSEKHFYRWADPYPRTVDDLEHGASAPNDQQLSETSQSIGFTVKVANSIRKLKELMRSDSSDLVMAMIHKFREADLTETFPELNASPHILVMTDEAHRSQYKRLGANFNKGLPNAARIGYTGTPIDKSEQVFGDYIDKYTMRQSIEDGVTLEIVYEGRTHNAEVADRQGMDTAFADVFSDYNLRQRMEILGYGSRDAYLEAESTIEAKAKDMIGHYLTHVFPNGYKAQVVATSREAAVRYKKHIDAALAAVIADLEQANPNNLDLNRLKKLTTDVIISGNHNDLPHLKAYSDKSKHEDLRFDYMLAFKKLTKCLNLVFPARQALDYMPDYQALTEINVLAGKHFRDERLSMKGIPPKLRAITDAYLESKGIDVKIKPISILDEDFQKQVGKHNRIKTKAAEVEHAIRHHLDVDLDDDPDLQASFAEALAKIFEDFRDNWKKIYEELEKLRERIIIARKEPTYGLHRKKQMPLFRMFAREIFGEGVAATVTESFRVAEEPASYGMSNEDLVNLTQKAFLVVERELRLTGFWESIPARNKLKAELQKTLLSHEFANLPGLVDKRTHIISRIMEIAEKNNNIILYAE